MIRLFTLLTQMCTAMAAVLTFLANEWLTVGLGINPWAAIPGATILMMVPYIVDHYFIEIVPEDEYDLSHIVLKPRKEWFEPPKPIDDGSSDFPKDVF